MPTGCLALATAARHTSPNRVRRHPALSVGEDQTRLLRRMRREMGRQGIEHDLGGGHGAVAGLRPERADDGFSWRHVDDLLRDSDRSAEEVDVPNRETEALALAQPSAGGERDQRPGNSRASPR